MDISRRSFIQTVMAAVAGGAVLDVDRLLWVPKPIVTVPAMPVALMNPRLSLADWAKRLDPDGRTAIIVELLSQSNTLLDDLVWNEWPRSAK